MTMQFTPYQIESMLDDYQHEGFPAERFVSENLSISEEAINEARQHFTPSEKLVLICKSTNEITELIEDRTEYDPIVDFVQQSRAGLFVDPIYIPKNSPPAFPLVKDYSKHDRKSSNEKQVYLESETTEKGLSYSKLNEGKTQIRDKVSINEAETEKDFSHSEQVNILISEKDVDVKNGIKSEMVCVKDNDSIDEKSIDREQNLSKSLKKSPIDSAAKLFEIIKEDDLDEEYEFEEKGLYDEDDVENDVVFGDGKIDLKSISKFVKSFPDSAIKFMFRKNLDGSNLLVEYEEIYIKWESRGLSRGRLKNYLFKLMKWDNFPDIPILEVVERIKDRQYYLKGKK